MNCIQSSIPGSETSESNFWLFAFRDSAANAQTFCDGIVLADVDGSGDYKLIVADEKKSMRIYSGMSEAPKTKLPSVPSGVATFFMPSFSRHIPVVAVAVGSIVLMFGNNRPLYKYEIRPLSVDEEEAAVWTSLISGETSVQEAAKVLQRRLEQGVKVSSRTLEFLLLGDLKEKEGYVTSNAGKPLKQLDTVTCMSSIAYTAEGEQSSLVIGTERRFLYLLDTSGAEALTIELPDTPAFLLTTGYRMGDYCIVIAARHGPIYSVKNGYLTSTVIHPDGAVCGMTRYDKQIVVATASNTLTHFSLKGKRHFSIYFSQPIRNIATMTDFVTGEARGIIVSLENGELRVYCGQILCHTSQLFSPTISLRFGSYGREGSALAAVLQNGAVIVKFLHRNALEMMQQKQQEVRESAEKDIPIPVPHLNSIFRTETEKEMKYGADMYRNFQYDLCHLRLLTDKKYIESFCPHLLTAGSAKKSTSPSSTATNVLQKSNSAAPISLFRHSSIHMTSSLEGMGSVFKIRVQLECSSPTQLEQLLLVCRYNTEMYHLPVSMIAIPPLSEGQKFQASVVVYLQEGESGGEPVTFSVLRDFHSQHPMQSLAVELPEKNFYE